MDYDNNRLPGHSGPGGLLLSCGKKKQKIKNVFRTAKKPCTHRALKADDGNRTRLPSLGSWYSTDELHLRFVFYYSTFLKKVIRGKGKNQKNQK